MQREYSLNVLPLSKFWSNAGTSILGTVRDQLIYDAQSLSFVESVMFQSLPGILLWSRSSYALDPILHSALIRQLTSRSEYEELITYLDRYTSP